MIQAEKQVFEKEIHRILSKIPFCKSSDEAMLLVGQYQHALKTVEHLHMRVAIKVELIDC